MTSWPVANIDLLSWKILPQGKQTHGEGLSARQQVVIWLARNWLFEENSAYNKDLSHN